MSITKHLQTLLATLAVTGLAIMPALAQEPAVESGHVHPAPAAVDTTAPAESTAPLVFEFTEHEFGNIHQGQSVTVEFPFVNKSEDKEVTIENVRTRCGCTAVALEKRSFKPGEGDKIGVTFNSTGRKGDQHKVVTVTTTDPEHPAYQLKIAGTIVTEVELTDRVVNFGAVQEGVGDSKEIALLDFSEKPVNILKVETHAQGVEVVQGEAVEYLDPQTGRTGRKTAFTVTVKPDFPAGRIAGTIVMTTDHPQEPVHNIAVTGMVRGDVSPSPNQIFFGVLAPESDVERVVRLMVRDNQKFNMVSFRIGDMTHDGQDFDLTKNVDVKLTAADANPNVQLLSVYFVSPKDRGTYKGTVTASGTIGEKKIDFNVPFQAVIRPEITQSPEQPSTADVMSGRALLPKPELDKQREEQRQKLLERRMDMEKRLEKAKERVVTE